MGFSDKISNCMIGNDSKQLSDRRNCEIFSQMSCTFHQYVLCWYRNSQDSRDSWIRQ